MVAFGVQNAKHNYLAIFDAIKKLIRESPRKHTTKTFVIGRTIFRCLFQHPNRSLNLVQKLVTQSAPLRVVLKLRFSQIGFGFRSDDNAPTHGRGVRRRALTSGHEDPVLGLAL